MQNFISTTSCSTFLISSDQLPIPKGTYRIKGITESANTIFKYLNANFNSVKWIKAPFSKASLSKEIMEMKVETYCNIHIIGGLLIQNGNLYLPFYQEGVIDSNNRVDVYNLIINILKNHSGGSIILDAFYFDENGLSCSEQESLSIIQKLCEKLSNTSVLIHSPKNSAQSYFFNKHTTQLTNSLVKTIKEIRAVYVNDFFNRVSENLQETPHYSLPIFQKGNNIPLFKEQVDKKVEKVPITHKIAQTISNNFQLEKQEKNQGLSLRQKALDAYSRSKRKSRSITKSNDFELDAIVSAARKEVYNELDESLWQKILRWNVPSAYMFYLESFKDGKYAHRAEVLLKDNLHWTEHNMLQQEKMQLYEAVKLFNIDKEEDDKKRKAFVEKVKETYKRLELEKDAIVEELNEERKSILAKEDALNKEKEKINNFEIQLNEREEKLNSFKEELNEKDGILNLNEQKIKEEKSKLVIEKENFKNDVNQLERERKKFAEDTTLEKTNLRKLKEQHLLEKEKTAKEKAESLKALQEQKLNFEKEISNFNEAKDVELSRIESEKNKISDAYEELAQKKQTWSEEKEAFENEISILTEKAYVLTDDINSLEEEKSTFNEEKAQLEVERRAFEAQRRETLEQVEHNKELEKKLNETFKQIADFDKKISIEALALIEKGKNAELELENAKALILEEKSDLENAKANLRAQIEKLEQAQELFIEKEKSYTKREKELQEKETELESLTTLLDEQQQIINIERETLQEQFDKKYDNLVQEKEVWEQNVKKEVSEQKEANKEKEAVLKSTSAQIEKDKKAFEERVNKWEANKEEGQVLFAKEKEALQQSIADKEKIIKELNKKQESFTRQIEELEKKLVLVKEKEKVQSTSLSDLTKEKNQLLQNFNTLKKETTEKEEYLSKENEELNKQKQQLEKAKSSVEKLLKDKQKQFDNNVNRHQQELQKVTTRFEKEKSALILKNEKREKTQTNTLARLKEELANTKKELQQTLQKAEKLENEYNDCLASQKELLVEVVSLKAQLTNIEDSDQKDIVTKDKEDEETIWAKTVSIGTEKAFSDYLKTFENGIYKTEANMHLDTLKNLSDAIETNQLLTKDEKFKVSSKKQLAINESEDEKLWLAACKENTIQAYHDYLHNSKEQNFATVAHQKIKELQQKK